MRAIETLFLKRLFKRLKDETSGNALLLVALGLPALIAGAGLGVDVTQWYMWKRELQYAVDQAAVAGAWARVRTDTSDTYQARATQEFNANLSVLKGMTTTPVVGLALYAGGVKTGPETYVENSVTVHATASRLLPFSGFLIGKAPAIYAYAQAAFESGTNFDACLESVDEDADVGITIGGNTVLTAGCGMASLSTSDTSIQVDGNPEVRLGTIEAAGGIDTAWFAAHDPEDTVKPYATGLFDPFKDLQPPNPTESQVARTYACVHGKTTSTATQTAGVTTTYDYWKGADPINDFAHMVTANYNNRNPNTNTSSSKTVIVDGVPTNGSTTTTYWTPLNGSKANTLWERKIVITDTTYTGVVTTTPPDTALLNPGTYSGIHVQCNTQFNTGVYILDGGGLTITGQYTVTGSAVMFVLKNGAYIDVAGGSAVTLTAMQASDLIARGVSADDASKLAGMLVFEASDSSSDKDRLNGNSNTTLNGKIYLPNSNIDFSGTAKVTSQCLMIASATIRFVGASNMTTFCPGGSTDTGVVVGSNPTRVKLVA